VNCKTFAQSQKSKIDKIIGHPHRMQGTPNSISNRIRSQNEKFTKTLDSGTVKEMDSGRISDWGKKFENFRLTLASAYLIRDHQTLEKSNCACK